MSSNLQIAIRFIFSRKRSMLMSLAGIVFGVGFFIITQAQTKGFEEFYIKTIIGTDSALRIEERFQNAHHSLSVSSSSGLNSFLVRNKANRKFISGIQYPQELRKALEPFRQITGISEVITGPITVNSTLTKTNARIQGVRLQDHLNATNLDQQIRVGSLEDYKLNPNSILIGIRLAHKLDVQIGEYLLLSTGEENRRYIVAAIFETGVEEIDKRRIFMHLSEARSLLNIPYGESFFQISLIEPKIAPIISAHISQTTDHYATSWQQREKTWLEVFRALRISSAITVSSIIFISGLSMFNTLAMLVMEKTKEIAILRSIGFTQNDIAKIFIWQGFLVLVIGTILGWLFGAIATYSISKLPIRIRGIFSTDTFVVSWDIYHYIWATIIAVIVVMIASYIPARRAAKLEPGNIIRGASS